MSFTITWGGDDAQHDPNLTCDACATVVCTLEEGDDLDVIVRTAEDHAEECLRGRSAARRKGPHA